MKKIIITLLVLLSITLTTQVTKAMSYADAIKSNKPMALLIYATWADDASNVMGKFKAQEAKYGDLYNFVLLDIASEDTKEYNKKYQIYSNLPYVILYRDNGKISRYLQKNCILEDSCFTEKLDFFIR